MGAQNDSGKWKRRHKKKVAEIEKKSVEKKEKEEEEEGTQVDAIS